MSKQGGDIEGDGGISREPVDKGVVSGDGEEEEEEQPKDPKAEEPEASGGETRAEPPESFSMTQEEKDLEVVYQNVQKAQGPEQPLEKKKLSMNVLEAIRARNTKGLEQQHTWLGPGTIIHVRWPNALKKENQSPWDTDWGYIQLTEEATVSKPPEKSAWNWIHPTKPDITGHIKLEPSRAWEIIKGVATKEQEKSRSDRNKDPGHNHNQLKAPNMTKIPLNVLKKQPEVVQTGAEEFLELSQQHPELFKKGPLEVEGILKYQKTVDISDNSNNFEEPTLSRAEPKPPKSKHSDDISSLNLSMTSRVTQGAGAALSTTALSTASSHMEGFVNGIDATIRTNLFNVMLGGTQITNPEVQTLVAREWQGLRLLKGLNRGIQEELSINVLKNIWKMLVPVILDFQDSYRMVAVLSTDNEEASQQDPDLQILNVLGIFNDTSSLVGAGTALEKITREVQAVIAEQYNEVWAISHEGQKEGVPGKVSKPTEHDENEDNDEDDDDENDDKNEEDEENKKTETVALKKIAPSVTPSTATSKPDNGDPLASSEKKTTGQDKEQEKINLQRHKELEKRQREIKRRETEQQQKEEEMKKTKKEQKEKEEFFLAERAYIERMRRKTEEQAESMKKSQEEDRKWAEKERRQKEDEEKKYRKVQAEHQKIAENLKKLKREEEEAKNWERDNDEKNKRMIMEQEENWKKREREIKEAEDKTIRDRIALKELKKKAVEERKKGKEKLEQERKKERERKNQEGEESDNKNKTDKDPDKSPDKKENTKPKKDDDKSDDDEEDEDKEKVKEKVRRSAKQRSNSVVSVPSSEKVTKKQFKMMSKELARNLQALDDLNGKIEENPVNMANGNEELKLLRTNDLTKKLDELEAEYESDDDLQDELCMLKILMDENNTAYKDVKKKLNSAESGLNNAANLSMIKMEIAFTPINAEVLSSPTLYAFLSDIRKRVGKSPLYLTSMRDNLADKILEALTKGNEEIVNQLRLAHTNTFCWEAIVTYLISKFGGALRTQELAIQHHHAYDRIGFPLESAIIRDQLSTIKQHLKATGSITHMIRYHKKVKAPQVAAAFLQQGGYTQKYLTMLNEKLPLVTQSENIDKMQNMTHEEGFAMLEAQLMALHTSAQNMANRYCGTQNIQTLLVANLNRDGKEVSLDEVAQI
eukprot:TRINITY_DN1437_c1_g1_i4.p1 TRINITY_DN1437_c1_g1~~TRINITY_DN1437_c1_g1_i4.p1  ORF type:complete len:1159 (+),score=364.41 TRINITY_DN1437_c1_g1_i4:829-4305(+)